MDKMKIDAGRARPWFCVALIFLSSLLWREDLGVAQPSGSEATIFFYNSEANLNNYATVKEHFDRYLSRYGRFKFQPFSKKEIFERIVETTKGPRILVLSSWHYHAMHKKSPLTPLLIGRRNGKSMFRKILMTKGPLAHIRELKDAVVASAGSVESTQTLLKEMLKQDPENLASSMSVLQVPKDIDALLSLDFGLARCAISTKESLRQMDSIQTRKSDLVVLAESGDILMPIAAIEKRLDMDESLTRLLHIMKDMKSSESGREKLSLLSLDEWVDIPPELSKKLEP